MLCCESCHAILQAAGSRRFWRMAKREYVCSSYLLVSGRLGRSWVARECGGIKTAKGERAKAVCRVCIVHVHTCTYIVKGCFTRNRGVVNQSPHVHGASFHMIVN